MKITNIITSLIIIALMGGSLAYAEIPFAKHQIDGDFDGASGAYAIDIDDDGDIDVLGTADYADDICWWENDGSENFTKHTIDSEFDGAISVYAIDLDKDGDVDVLGAALEADNICWWENDGSENSPSIRRRSLMIILTELGMSALSIWMAMAILMS